MSRRTVARQRSQAMVEFALVAPILVLLFFGTIDFGRLVYVYVTLNQAVNEGARVAIRASAQLPTNADVQSAVRVHAAGLTLATPCPNGPVTGTAPPPDQGWIYITEPDPPSVPEPLSPGLQNAPGGEPWAVATGSCSAVSAAHDHAPLQVTIRFNFAPFTPLIGAITGTIVITAAAVYATEY